MTPKTTGVLTGYRHRIAELAVLHLAPDGATTGEWSTLINPQRDLTGQLAELLAGRVVVAHNWPFDCHAPARGVRRHRAVFAWPQLQKVTAMTG